MASSSSSLVPCPAAQSRKKNKGLVRVWSGSGLAVWFNISAPVQVWVESAPAEGVEGQRWLLVRWARTEPPRPVQRLQAAVCAVSNIWDEVLNGASRGLPEGA